MIANISERKTQINPVTMTNLSRDPQLSAKRLHSAP